MFINFTLTAINNFNKLLKYGKLKGWTDIAPPLKQSSNKDKEVLTVSESSHIINHINIRYDHIELTKIYKDFVHDIEFKKIVEKGKNILQKQVNDLEQIALNFGLVLPERPSAAFKEKGDPEFINDKYIFKTIYRGIQYSTDLHIRAIIESTRNDNIKNFFMNLLKEELNIFDSFTRYGKIKGWTHIYPHYNV